ncbi:MAG: hypothetical protein HUK14_08110 [Muribaculaceae bacterium]|nr:hypothetical protein [Muribaculaceae bacterium]
MFNFFSKKKSEPQQLFFHTDVHCHVVPGVDDGSPDVDTSVELIERMESWGLRRIIATPHMTQDTFENTPDILDPPLFELKEALEKKDSKVNLSRSAEHRIDDFFVEQLEKGLILPFPGNFILVENSFMQEPWNLDQFIFDLKLKGYKPIMAHPERFVYYQNNRKRYDDLHRAGNLFQINLVSLSGYYGKQCKATAEYLLEKGYVAFIGTDLHHHKHADSIEAYLASRDYRRLAEKAPRLLNDTIPAE